MACAPCAARARAAQGSTPTSAQGVASPVPTPAMYEVITRRGTATGRKFTSALAAQDYAGRIGGTVRTL